MKINKQNKNDKEVLVTHEDDNSINVSIFNNKLLMEVVGSFDNNLKELEKISGSKIYFRGNSISIKGKSSLGKQDNENFDLPDLIENLLPSLAINSISLPSGIFLTISYKVCAGTVVEPFSMTEQLIDSVIEISISVADKTREDSVASNRMFERIGIVFFFSTILCT